MDYAAFIYASYFISLMALGGAFVYLRRKRIKVLGVLGAYNNNNKEA